MTEHEQTASGGTSASSDAPPPAPYTQTPQTAPAQTATAHTETPQAETPQAETPQAETSQTETSETETSPTAAPLLEARAVCKYFGSVNALQDVTLKVNAGEVTCVLGDNGAGKSTLIKILSGVYHPDKGDLLVDGVPANFAGPRDARARGIATVFQDLATVPLMSVWRNFFLGNEPTKGRGVLQRLNTKQAQRIMHDEMAKMGIDVRDPNQLVGTLSGGERQAVAIARAVYFGAKVLILDEPTSALGVRQSGIVLKYIVQARSMGRGVIFITHNPHHAYPVGDRFVLLKRGRMMGSHKKADTSLEQLTSMMAGGAELEQLSHELASLGSDGAATAVVAKELAAEVKASV
jgi:simple sugar transport system ATP-binding protein